MKVLQQFAVVGTLALLVAGCASLDKRPRVILRDTAPASVPPAPPKTVRGKSEIPPAEVVPPLAPLTNAVPGAMDFRSLLAVQACLDRVNFSGGATDGRMSDSFRSALRAWQGARGLPVTGEVDRNTLARCGDLSVEFVNYTISTADHAALTNAPTGWRERARLQSHGYVTILEAVAELAHASEEAIRLLNPGAGWPNPPAGTEVTLPKYAPGKHVDLARLVISLSRRELEGFDAEGKLVLHVPCSIARDVNKRPVGELKVVNAAANPFYTFDPAVFPDDPEAQTIEGNLYIPAGPNNPVGVAWIGLDRPGYGIHGTPWPEDIGKTESHGCFRLANWNARKLLRMVKSGTPVTVEP